MANDDELEDAAKLAYYRMVDDPGEQLRRGAEQAMPPWEELGPVTRAGWRALVSGRFDAKPK